jgi:2-C-methyl-D-erythritol 4-phosphate cytidylyltransferase
MTRFSVVVLTAPPPGLSGETGGSLVKIDGREALLRSVELFLNRDNIKQIQLVFTPEYINDGKAKFGAHLGFSGVKLVTGGPRWIDQIIAAAPTIAAESTHVLIHDAARPAVPYSDIDAILDAAGQHPAVALTSPARSTMIETDEGGFPVAVHSPKHLSHLLTPQVFGRSAFDEMVAAKAELHPSKLTLIKGSGLNVRIGGASDASLAKAMIGLLPRPKMKASINPFDEAQW